MTRQQKTIGDRFDHLSETVAHKSGTTGAFMAALGVVAGWALLGPVFDFSDTWQLVINTGTTIVTFIMVFLIQRSQNKDALAIHLKLNELVAAMGGASNRMIESETLTERELAVLHKHYHELAQLAKKETDLTRSHSVEEAENRHRVKMRAKS